MHVFFTHVAKIGREWGWILFDSSRILYISVKWKITWKIQRALVVFSLSCWFENENIKMKVHSESWCIGFNIIHYRLSRFTTVSILAYVSQQNPQRHFSNFSFALSMYQDILSTCLTFYENYHPNKKVHS